MSNWFAGIGQAASGVNAARYGLSVVGQNMTNAATVGYTRQTVSQASVDASSEVGLHAGPGSPAGVKISSTDRMTDPVLDTRVRSAHARAGLATTTADQLKDVSDLLGEPSDSGLSAQLGTFWKAWGSMANNPAAGSAARSVVLKDAAQVAGTINGLGRALDDAATATSLSLTADVSSLDTTARQLANLNGSIVVGTTTGADVNSLLDQRDQLLDRMSKLSGADVTIEADGSATVSLGGRTLVSGTTAAAVTVDASAAVSVGGTAVTVGDGTIGARVTALTTTVPQYRAALDAVADKLAAVVNTAQAAGVDATGATGTAVFGGSGATGIHVVLTDPDKLAASTVAGTLDGKNAQALSQTGTSATSPDAAFRALVATVASDSASATQVSATASAVSSSVDGLKSSMSGVSIDQEAAQMLVYQQAFNASARLLSTMDDMLDTLINRTGAGR